MRAKATLRKLLYLTFTVIFVLTMLSSSVLAYDHMTNDEQFEGGRVEVLAYDAKRTVSAANSKLSDLDATIYQLLRGYIAEVAAGSRSSTVFALAVEDLALEKTTWKADELGVESIVVDGSITAEAKSAIMEKTTYDQSLIVNMLLADCPYELYWYDKTAENAVAVEGLSVEASYVGEWTISVAGSLTFSFAVAGDFSAGAYSVDADKVSAAHKAVENAEAIVAEYADYPDELKLRAYKDAICSLVTYDHDAANGGKPYGAPWQMISVFDGSEATNVVCEGYSKAFKYLCDISEFEGSVTCIMVTGTMEGGTGAGNHMWNIVSIDGVNYLVDVTNCDEGSVGADDLLFMKGGLQGSAADGYAFSCGITTVVYQYDAQTKELWDGSSLALSAADYVYSSGNCGDHAVWSFDYETGILTISGTGNLYDWMTVFEEDTGLPVPGLSPPWYFVGKDNIIGVVIEPGITSIGASSFSHCKNLAWISIPDTVTGIGSMTFMYSGIKSLAIPDSVTGSLDFQFCCYCEDLETVSIGNGITEIGNSAFSECHKLKSVVMGTSIKSIGTSAFHGCSALESITLPDGGVGLPDGLKVIGEHAFYICESLKSLRIPDSVEEIGEEAFAACKSLTGEITWPASITTVSDGAFRFCESLEKVVIPDSVTSIGNLAFSSCANLTSVTIPDSVTSIGEWSFSYCTGLTSMTIPDSVTGIGDYTFYGCNALNSVTIPKNVTSISARIFFDCTGLTNVTIPASVTRIDDGAFDNCTSLTDVYYGGTEEDWGEIYIASDNVPLTTAAIHYARPLVISSVKANKTTVKPGEPITWTAAASGGTGTLKYYFILYKDGTQIATRSYSKAKTFSYTPTDAGTYKVKVYVKDEDGTKVHKTGAAVTIAVPPVITTQPSPKTVTSGKTAVFTVTASGTGLSYQWQYSKDGSTWTNKSGATAASYTVTAKASYNGLRYRCKVTNAGGSVYSNSAKLTVTSSAAPVISSVKADKTAAAAGTKITWTATASGGTGTLQYYFILYKDGTKVKTRAYSTVNTFSYTPLEAGTYKVKVYVKDTVGNKVNKTSAAVTVTLGPPAIISVKAGKTSSAVGEKITWTATAVGSEQPLKYYFILYKDGVKIKTRSYSTTNTFSYTPTEAGAYKVRVYVKDAADAKVNKLSAAVTVTG